MTTHTTEELPTPKPCISAGCDKEGRYSVDRVMLCPDHMLQRDKDFSNSSESVWVCSPNAEDEGNYLIDSLEEGWYIVNFAGSAAYSGFWHGPWADKEAAEADMERLGYGADERLLFIAPKKWER